MEIPQSYHSPATEDDMNMTDCMEDYHFWRKLSRCVRCHTKDAFTMNGRCMCAECADKENAYCREYWRKHPELSEKRRLRRKERRERLKADGLCVTCAKREAVPGKADCSVCAAKKTAETKNPTQNVILKRRSAARTECVRRAGNPPRWKVISCAMNATEKSWSVHGVSTMTRIHGS